jgi:hypothetical protein
VRVYLKEEMIMTKKAEISKKVNLLDEAYRLLYYWVNIDDIEGKRVEFLDNYQSDLDVYNKKFETVTKMYHYITEHLQADKEQIDYYFKERNSSMSTLGALAILLNYHRYDNELKTYEEHLANQAKYESLWNEANNASD